MSIDQHNRELLQKILHVPKNKTTQSVSYNQIGKWHDYRYLPETISNFGQLYLYEYNAAHKYNKTHKYNKAYKYNNLHGSGSSLNLKQYAIENVEYLFKIDILNAKHMAIQAKQIVEDKQGKVYFLSLLQEQDNVNFNCIHLTIFHEDRLGLVNGFSKKYPCVGIRNKDKLDIYSGPKEGAILIQGLILFCRQYQSILGIDELELDDSSVFPCNGIVNINLLISNQLKGMNPYYMKFGFKPRDPLILDHIKANLKLMTSYKVTVDLLDIISDITDITVPIEIVEMIGVSIDSPLCGLLSAISEYDCIYYSKFYKKLYDRLKLKELSGDDTAFRLVL